MKILTNDNKTILVGITNDNNYILKYQENFYKMQKEEFAEIFDEKELILKKEIKENPIYAIGMILFILTTLFTYFITERYVIIDSNFLVANLVLLINILIHEIGHIFILRLFYKIDRIKIGFKLYFIYPAFYVDTSDSYLLPKYKRIAVYLAGTFMNCLYVLSCILLFPSISKYNYAIVSTILINFVPIIKSDGYYAIASLFDKYNPAKSNANQYFEDAIRGFLMFALLIFVSKLNK